MECDKNVQSKTEKKWRPIFEKFALSECFQLLLLLASKLARLLFRGYNMAVFISAPISSLSVDISPVDRRLDIGAAMKTAAL